MLLAQGVVGDAAGVLGLEALGRGLDRVVRDLGVVGLAEGRGVDRREMADVQEALDLAPRGGVEQDPVGHEPDIVRVGPLVELRERRLGVGHDLGPDEPEGLAHGMRPQAKLGRDRGPGIGGNFHAPAVGGVTEAVVLAHQLVALHPAEAECGAAVEAKVPGDVGGPVAGPPDDELLVQQPDRDGPVGDVGPEGHRKPVAGQHPPVGGIDGAAGGQPQDVRLRDHGSDRESPGQWNSRAPSMPPESGTAPGPSELPNYKLRGWIFGPDAVQWECLAAIAKRESGRPSG